MFTEIMYKYLSSETALYNYFGIPKNRRDRKIEFMLDCAWNVVSKSFRWADSPDGFSNANYYSFDGDYCDEAVYGEYEVGEYVAILIGCGEHEIPQLLIVKLENKYNKL